MALHGGVLSAHSAGLGQGCTFSMELPLYSYGEGGAAHPATSEGSEVSFQDISFNLSVLPTAKATSPDAVEGIEQQQQQQEESQLQSPHSTKSTTLWARMTSQVLPLGAVAGRVAAVGSYEVVEDEEDARSQSTRPLKPAVDSNHSNGEEVLSDIEVPAHSTAPAPAPRPVRTWATGLDILVVDDSGPNRKVMRSLLTSRGHTVSDAVDGKDFLRVMGYLLVTSQQGDFQIRRLNYAAAQTHFDIILIDDNMPVINGSDAVQLLRATGYAGKILGISGDVDIESVSNFIRKGVNDVLCKPVNIEMLRTKVEALLC